MKYNRLGGLYLWFHETVLSLSLSLSFARAVSEEEDRVAARAVSRETTGTRAATPPITTETNILSLSLSLCVYVKNSLQFLFSFHSFFSFEKSKNETKKSREKK